MTTETLTEKMPRQNTWLLDCLTQVGYFAQLDVFLCKELASELRDDRSGLRDMMIYYRQNREDWVGKIRRMIKTFDQKKGTNMLKTFDEDLRSEDLTDMFHAMWCLKRAQDIGGVSDILRLLIEVKDVSAIKTNLQLIIQNQINKEAV